MPTQKYNNFDLFLFKSIIFIFKSDIFILKDHETGAHSRCRALYETTLNR